MTATYSQARDEILAVVKAAWDTTTFPMLWPDIAGERPTTRTPWARTVIKHTVGGQHSLASHSGQSRWLRQGMLSVSIFTPIGEGLSRSYPLAKVIADAVEGTATPSGVWFRKATINEIGDDGEWFMLNVLTDFEYTEIK